MKRLLAASAAAGTLLLGGCAGPDPAQLTPPVAPQRPPTAVAGTSSCGSGTFGYSLCVQREQAAAERVNARSQADFEQAQAQYQRQMERYREAAAEAGKSSWERFFDRLTAAVIIGAALIAVAIGAGVSSRKDAAAKVPEGRDPAGPAVQEKVLETAIGDRFFGILAMVGAGVLGFGLWGAGGAVLVGAPAALVAWALGKRISHLGDVRAGYAAAEADYQRDLAAAIAAAEAETTTPHSDLGLGLDAVTPAVRAVPEPILTRAEALVYGRTGGVELAPGSAAALLLDRTGRATPAAAFWLQACQAAKLGSASEDGTFTPSVTLLRVAPLAGGDATLTVKPDNISTGEQQLSGVTAPLIRAAGIRAAVGGWERDHEAGEWQITVTNRGPAKAQVEEEWV